MICYKCMYSKSKPLANLSLAKIKALTCFGEFIKWSSKYSYLIPEEMISNCSCLLLGLTISDPCVKMMDSLIYRPLRNWFQTYFCKMCGMQWTVIGGRVTAWWKAGPWLAGQQDTQPCFSSLIGWYLRTLPDWSAADIVKGQAWN